MLLARLILLHHLLHQHRYTLHPDTVKGIPIKRRHLPLFHTYHLNPQQNIYLLQNPELHLNPLWGHMSHHQLHQKLSIYVSKRYCIIHVLNSKFFLTNFLILHEHYGPNDQQNGTFLYTFLERSYKNCFKLTKKKWQFKT